MHVVDDDQARWGSLTPNELRYLFELGVRPVSVTLLPFIAWLLAVVGGSVRSAAAVLIVGLVAMVVLARPDPMRRRVEIPLAGTATGTFVVPRLVTVTALAVIYVATDVGAWMWFALVALTLAILLELPTRALLVRAEPYAHRIPGAGREHNWTTIPPSLPFATSCVALLVAMVTPLVTGVEQFSFLLILLGSGAVLAVAAESARRIGARQRLEPRLPALLADLSPKFVVHWDAPRGTAYQLAMWLPHLEQVGAPFFIVLRNPDTFSEIAAITDRPVLVRHSLEQLDRVITPSVRAAFYVNTATSNAHLVRYPALVHVQLNHGDSDKVQTQNRVFRMYDHNFVAGQAAIDRFGANDVPVHDGFFRIVGRPQVGDLSGGPAHRSPDTPPVILYAPTWAGYHADSRYSSLDIGEDIISALISEGCRVLFRPHPYARRSDTFRQTIARIHAALAADNDTRGNLHVFGEQAEETLSLADCINRADLLLSDVSSIVSDWLFTEKPYALVPPIVVGEERFTSPLARGSYEIRRDRVGASVAEALTNALSGDPLSGARRELRVYYLGDFPRSGYQEHFIDAVHEIISAPLNDNDPAR